MPLGLRLAAGRRAQVCSSAAVRTGVTTSSPLLRRSFQTTRQASAAKGPDGPTKPTFKDQLFDSTGTRVKTQRVEEARIGREHIGNNGTDTGTSRILAGLVGGFGLTLEPSSFNV